MDATPLGNRISEAITPVMVLAGIAWGSTGEAKMGLAALAVALLIVGMIAVAAGKPTERAQTRN